MANEKGFADPKKNAAPDHVLEAARAGDREALNALLAQHRGGVYRYGLTVCRTTEDTEDAVQLTLWSASRAISSFRRASSFTTWLFTIVRNWCLRLERRNRRTCAVELPEQTRDDAADPELTVQTRELWRAIADAVATLEPQYREVVILRDVEGRTAPEVAQELGITIAALKSRLHRARSMLRERLPPDGDLGGPDDRGHRLARLEAE